MNKKLIILWVLLSVSLMMQSCKNYYYLKHTPADQNEDRNLVHHLKFSNESIKFVTYSDYKVNTINKKYIFFTTKDIDHILKTNNGKPFSEQFLFMYTNMSIYNNLLGFYYEGISLDEAMEGYHKKPDADLGNGALYIYDSGKFNVVDIYKKCDGGVIRLINLNNPNEKDP